MPACGTTFGMYTQDSLLIEVTDQFTGLLPDNASNVYTVNTSLDTSEKVFLVLQKACMIGRKYRYIQSLCR